MAGTYDWAVYTIKYALADRKSLDFPQDWEWKSAIFETEEDGNFQIDDTNATEIIHLANVSKEFYIVDVKVSKTIEKRHPLNYYDDFSL